MYCYDGSPALINCTITRNAATAYGDSGMGIPGYSHTGGVYFGGEGSPTLINCTIWGNSASTYDGTTHGGGVSGSSSVTMVNCIVGENTPYEIGGAPTVTYSCPISKL